MSVPCQIGYCTNVHAGADLSQTRANLENYAFRIKKRVSPDRAMGIGLWLSASAADKLLRDNQVEEFAGWLDAAGLLPFTLNGFPYGDFHSLVVKHQVYLPTWHEAARYDYTRNLITILDRLLPAGMEGSISTLPIAWGSPSPSRQRLEAATHFLRKTAADLAELERRTGRLIYLCIEPEPGCFLQMSADVLGFFDDWLFRGGDEALVRRHVRICHDVCHQVVMFEDQEEVLARYRAAGIKVGKIQVSSAVCMPLHDYDEAQRDSAVRQLSEFVEERYLHQTVCRANAEAPAVFYEDLPLALAANRAPGGEWRTHFHVPIYLEKFGLLKASQAAILQCVQSALTHADTSHFEVETYAWGVLPAELQQPDLAVGIADEMNWFMGQVAKMTAE